MTVNRSLIEKDLKHIWHPCMQMKDFEQYPPLVVHKARGSYLFTDQGPLIDSMSSWWCKSLGHGHPDIIAAIQKQLHSFEHIISATTTHPLLAELGEQLARITHKQHVLFASDGASAVEIALKLTLHAHQIKGETDKKQFLALKNAYHGETLAALSVSDLGLYKKPYEGFGARCHFIEVPYLEHDADLWENTDTQWQNLLPTLEKLKSKLSAIIVEPLVQGAAGMRCYSAHFLSQLSQWAKKNGIYLIADEIMTGLGRTGQWLACHHADVDADLICLSKGLTAGTIPMSCVLIDNDLYQHFYADHNQGKSFLHSHTFSANALAVSAAVATIKTIEAENRLDSARQLGDLMLKHFLDIAKQTQKLSSIRRLGAVVAADLAPLAHTRVSFKLYQEAIKRGALLRPIGNTLYWMPPLNTSPLVIDNLAEITLDSINATY